MLYLNLKSARDSHHREKKRARIILKGYWGDEENDICLSGTCFTYSEIERDVNFLKRELDNVLAKARQQFASEQT